MNSGFMFPIFYLINKFLAMLLQFPSSVNDGILILNGKKFSIFKL